MLFISRNGAIKFVPEPLPFLLSERCNSTKRDDGSCKKHQNSSNSTNSTNSISVGISQSNTNNVMLLVLVLLVFLMSCGAIGTTTSRLWCFYTCERVEVVVVLIQYLLHQYNKTANHTTKKSNSTMILLSIVLVEYPRFWWFSLPYCVILLLLHVWDSRSGSGTSKKAVAPLL